MIRLFAAIAIPDEIGEGLVRRQQGLPGARWRPPESLHITLRFAGDISEDQAEDFDAALQGVQGPPLDLTLSGVGAFGDGFDIHAVWAGLEENDGLMRLAKRCEGAARRAGLKPDTRVYKPHVTLAYLRRPDPTRVAAWIQGHNLLKSPPFRIAEFGLFSSWPGDGGSAYRHEQSYPLTASRVGSER